MPRGDLPFSYLFLFHFMLQWRFIIGVKSTICRQSLVSPCGGRGMGAQQCGSASHKTARLPQLLPPLHRCSSAPTSLPRTANLSHLLTNYQSTYPNAVLSTLAGAAGSLETKLFAHLGEEASGQRQTLGKQWGGCCYPG